MKKYTFINGSELRFETIQNDMKSIQLDGVEIAVAIKDNDGIILDHVNFAGMNDGTIFPNKKDGSTIKTWKATMDYIIELIGQGA